MTCAIHARIDEYDLEEQRLVSRFHEVRAEKRILRQALEILDEPDHKSGADGGPSAPLQEVETPADLYLRPGGMTRLYLDVAASLARKSSGRVNVTDVAREVKVRDLSKAKLGSLRATIHRAMARSEQWQYAGDGTFAYIPRADEPSGG